jgi:DNA-binding NtrC family response regulator
MNTILIIDDDDQLRRSFKKLLSDEGLREGSRDGAHDDARQGSRVITAASAEAGIEAFKTQHPDLVILDIRLPGMSGLEAFKALHDLDSKIPIIIMTAYGTTETAINATKMGAFDYILKPFDIPQMLTTITQALHAGRFVRKQVALNPLPQSADRDAIIGSGAAMQEVFKSIGRVAATDATVLVRGASGTGKELVARAIYQHSQRAERPFLVINCVAIPETLLESELFGYEKGAFTGASHRRIGKIEQANGGTIFLDEIGDMPIKLQAKILRLLQERSIERLGGRTSISVDVRIIAATNRDLEEMIAASQFREDLYYRLKVVTIWLPQLNQRTEDIEALAGYHLACCAADLGIEAPRMTREALETLRQLPWPGNVRELANTLQKALIFNRSGQLRSEDILEAVQDRGMSTDTVDADLDESLRTWIREEIKGCRSGHLFESSIDRFTSILVEEALNHTGGNRSRAAKLLGLSRPTLHAKIDKYRLTLKTAVQRSSR